jgi:hypothetical protein
MDFKKTFATNRTKELEGVWFPGPDGSSYLVARQGNKNFNKLMAEVAKPHRKLIEMGKADDELLTEITAEVVSRTILLDWKGVTDDGKPVAYSNEEAKRRLIDYPDFADMIAALSKGMAAYQDQEKAAAAGN